MTERKHHNSILVLATLGVYLGLVLAGATPQILAQAATTRQFDVKDEIEVKDDLDKKPEPTANEFGNAVGHYFVGTSTFLTDLAKLSSIGKFDSSQDNIQRVRRSIVPCSEGKLPFSHGLSGRNERWLGPAIDDASYITERFRQFGDCIETSAGLGLGPSRISEIELVNDGNEFKYSIAISFASAERATTAASSFRLAASALKLDSSLIETLYKNTAFATANDQVTIVTRLARADLDALLATNAK